MSSNKKQQELKSLGASQMAENKPEKKRTKMVNITINIPEIYDKNIQNLIKMHIIPSRSEAIRNAIRDFLHNEYENLKLLGYFEEAV
ncbi:MAG: ribbon-helix-helix domain-containing protein [Promethearchaeota archaeon]